MSPPKKRGELEERGRAMKRRALNRAKNKESEEEIKEYIYDDKSYEYMMIKTGLIDRYDDYE